MLRWVLRLISRTLKRATTKMAPVARSRVQNGSLGGGVSARAFRAKNSVDIRDRCSTAMGIKTNENSS